MKLLTITTFSLMLFGCGSKTDSMSDTGSGPVDSDNDGFAEDVDCDDTNSDVNPDAMETCDGIDNDCDTEVDEGEAEDAITWYADSDGDTFGDASVAVTACEAPDGHVEDDTDCDDQNSSVHPNASEVCDGIDNDCDPSTDESGSVAWTDSSGTVSDVTADASGTASAPMNFVLPEGTLNFCEGTFYTNLEIEGSASVTAQSEDPTTTILNGGGIGPVVQIVGDLTEVDLSDLTLTGGEARTIHADLMEGPTGGGLVCTSLDEATETIGEIQLDLDNVLITGNHSGYVAGGIMAIGCDLTMNNSEVSSSTADLGIGGMLVLGGTHELNGVDIVSNDGNQSYAGGVFAGYAERVNAEFNDVIVAYNSSLDVPGIGFNDGDFTWNGSAGSEGSGVWKNEGVATSLGALNLMSATLNGDMLDFGGHDAMSDNTFIDISAFDADFNRINYEATDDVSFVCDDTGCGTPSATALDMTGLETQASDFSYIGFQVFVSTSQQTLMNYDWDLTQANTACETQFLVLETTDEVPFTDKGSNDVDWDVAWVSDPVMIDLNNLTNSGTVGLLLEKEKTYAVGIIGTDDCKPRTAFGLDWDYENVGADLGFGILGGYRGQTGSNIITTEFSPGDTLKTNWSNPLILPITLNVTEL